MTPTPTSRSPSIPLAQRDLRAPRPRRPAARAPATAEHLARLAARLTPRDRWLARLLAEHRVLTSAQITQAAFTTHRAANARLLNLYRWRVLDRFQPYTGAGAAHHHYVLDTAGHALLAAEDGIDPADLRWRPEHAIAIAHSMRLAHTVAVNGFFTALIAIALRPGGSARLEAWWSEDRCARLFADHVRPDAYGRWTHSTPGHGGGVVEFFLEHDQGTETHTRLTGKLGGYAALATATGITTPVLFRFRTTARETAARPALAAALTRLDQPRTVPVATSSADHTPPTGTDPGPAGPAWLPIHPTNPATRGPDGRLRLAELPAAWRLPSPATQTDAGVDRPPEPAGRPRFAPPPPMPPRSAQTGGGGGRW